MNQAIIFSMCVAELSRTESKMRTANIHRSGKLSIIP